MDGLIKHLREDLAAFKSATATTVVTPGVATKTSEDSAGTSKDSTAASKEGATRASVTTSSEGETLPGAAPLASGRTSPALVTATPTRPSVTLTTTSSSSHRSKESSATTTEPSTSGESEVLATVTRLLQAHTEALAAQTRATAAQHLPSLKPFTGEGKLTEEDSFERWLEHFEERASLAGWSSTQKLHQLKLLLEKTALRAFRVFPVEEREDYDKAIAALKARFRSVDIEELRGLEFHHKVQGPSESVEELGLELQRLGHKAFPTVRGRELDRLLKGRFFQALQRSLAAEDRGSKG